MFAVEAGGGREGGGRYCGVASKWGCLALPNCLPPPPPHTPPLFAVQKHNIKLDEILYLPKGTSCMEW